MVSGFPPPVQILIKSVAKRHRRLFKHCQAEVGEEDVEAEATYAAIKAHNSFKFGRGATYTTFLHRAIACDLTDFARKQGRRRDWHEKAGKLRSPEELAGEFVPPVDTSRTIPEQFRDVYLAGKKLLPDPSPKPGSRKWSTLAHKLAVRWLWRQKRESTRGMMYILNTNNDLREAIGIRTRVSIKWLQTCQRLDTLFSGIS